MSLRDPPNSECAFVNVNTSIRNGSIHFHRTKFGRSEKAEFVQYCVSLARPITPRHGLTGTLWTIFLHELETHSFTKPGEEAELSLSVPDSPEAELG